MVGGLRRRAPELITHKMPCLVQLPSSSKWGQQSVNTINHNQNALSLAEIQKLEEERERQAREEVGKQSFPPRMSRMQYFSFRYVMAFRKWVSSELIFFCLCSCPDSIDVSSRSS